MTFDPHVTPKRKSPFPDEQPLKRRKVEPTKTQIEDITNTITQSYFTELNFCSPQVEKRNLKFQNIKCNQIEFKHQNSIITLPSSPISEENNDLRDDVKHKMFLMKLWSVTDGDVSIIEDADSMEYKEIVDFFSSKLIQCLVDCNSKKFKNELMQELSTIVEYAKFHVSISDKMDFERKNELLLIHGGNEECPVDLLLFGNWIAIYNRCFCESVPVKIYEISNQLFVDNLINVIQDYTQNLSSDQLEDYFTKELPKLLCKGNSPKIIGELLIKHIIDDSETDFDSTLTMLSTYAILVDWTKTEKENKISNSIDEIYNFVTNFKFWCIKDYLVYCEEHPLLMDRDLIQRVFAKAREVYKHELDALEPKLVPLEDYYHEIIAELENSDLPSIDELSS